MTSVHPPVHADASGLTTLATLGTLGTLGTPVDCTGLRRLSLEGPDVVWLVVAGAMDLFAVDEALQGRWQPLGRLEPGELLPGPAVGPRHTLVGRPLPGCVLHRIQLRELFFHPHHSPEWSGYGAGGLLSPLEDAFAQGVGHGLRLLFEACADGWDFREFADEDIQWLSLAPGSLVHGAVHGHATARDLFIEPTTWQRLVDQQSRLLFALDRWIDELERAHQDRAEAGVQAGAAARAQADRALLTSLSGSPRDRSQRKRSDHDRSDHGRGGDRSATAPATDDATLTACRLVAAAAGIVITTPVTGAPAEDGADGADDRQSPVERLATASRFRTRPVRLSGRWWREDAGPLLGFRAGSGAPGALLWRRGGYTWVDPTTRRRSRISESNADHFAPEALLFHRPLPEQPLTLWRLLRFSLHGTRADLYRLVLSGLVAVALGTLVPLATGQVLGTYVPNAESDAVVRTSVAILATTLVSAAFLLMENVSILRLEGRVEATLQPAVWDRLLRLPTRFFAGRSTGELASAAMGISAIRRILSGVSSVAVQAGTVAVVNLVLLLGYSVPLTLAALAVLVVIGAVFLGLGLWQLRHQRALTTLTNKLNNRAFQTLRGLPKLRVAGAEDFAYGAWATEFARSRELQRRVGRIRNLTTVCSAVYLPLCMLGLFALLAGPARGALSASGFLTFASSLTMVLTSVTQLTGSLLAVAAALPLFEQLRPVLDAAPEVPGGSALPGTLSGAIEVANLSFRYDEDGPLVLHDLSFRIEPGEFVAVVGASGCGKSTLLRLLVGFERPTTGAVRYDGQDLAGLDRAAVRRQLGVVLQDAQPFGGSILDCVRGTEPHTVEEVWEAVAMAGLAEDVRAMPMGLHTVLADGGGTVSGGQRQRLMIAQALVRRPRILLFDEATSALDNETQGIVTAATRALHATRVVIAHRLSTVMDADRVLVLSHGQIVQQGTPAQLLAETEGLFRELVRRQLG
ncbi:NHLP bacteriocin export ABC transporter permease/ATPase subunit [Streptacidiphilus jiangxiensis]|uniref:NHLM bacteriocin system ABC transporter, ATP-binding protein n=1 Tax=Streptacidiphilus jiangxiensis TaxID=235985 RepID=A0A1H7V4E7_STRJI|nr:NHLP bacteriocin export ABC transporter permease/ATPase subunit [Streptacidiphilus jiangxiensis]SEM04004.1 NHLM bacteriocin system ABC transporter, ATP-binding protein [Streptacidiphilus jiangxiensis]